MPTYEYACKACGHHFEAWQSMTDDPLTICPECGGELRKVFAPPAITFKGSGFYATDHGKQAKKSEGDGTKKEAASTSSRSDGSGSSAGGSSGSSGGGGTGSSGPKEGGSSSGSTASSASKGSPS
jgi:putative FmdB family regulatory protein